MRQGIILDMDNTLIQSEIDFSAMKRDLADYLSEQSIIPKRWDELDNHTCSTLIEWARSAGLSHSQENRMWRIAEEHEIKGMEGAGLEPGAAEMLERLKDRFVLTVLTNNSQQAAEVALEKTGIIRYFQLVAGREKVEALKPSPSGVLRILRAYPHIPANRWLSVGDSWIDGKAASDAGVAFISYRKNPDILRQQGVHPLGKIDHWQELPRFLGGV